MKTKYFALFAALCSLALLLNTTLSAQQPALTISTKDEIAADVKAAPCKNGDRLEAVRALFKKMGATNDEIAVESKGKLANLVVTKKGITDETIIVGAHYDKVADGCGAIDNWTGITIIAHLYRTLRNAPTAKTLKFVAFDAEELGLLGSSAMAKAIPKEKRAGICEMINLDSFGFTYPRTLSDTSSPKLVAVAKALSAELKMPFEDVRIAGAEADSLSFLRQGIPSVTFDGLDGNWDKFLHSSNDKVENINISSVFVGYNYTLRFIAKMEESGCDDFRKK